MTLSRLRQLIEIRAIAAIALVMLGALWLGSIAGAGGHRLLLNLAFVLAAVGLAIPILRKPELGLYLATALLLIDSRSLPGPINLSASNLFLTLTLVALMPRLWQMRKRYNMPRFDVTRGLPILLGGGLLLAGFMSLAGAQFPSVVLRTLVTIIGQLLYLALVLVLVRDGQTVINVMRAYVSGATACAVIGIAQSVLAARFGIELGTFYDLVGVTYLDFPRVTSTWLDPNVFGLYLVTALPFVWVASRRNWIRLPILVLLASGIALSYSRTAWVAAVVSVWFWVALLLRSNTRTSKDAPLSALRWIFLLLLTAFGLAIANYLHVWDLLVDINRNAVEGRIDMNLIGWRYFLSSPLVGVGAGNFLLLADVFTHNSYLAVLVEYGVFGGLVWAGLLVWTLWRAVTNVFILGSSGVSRSHEMILAALASLLVAGLSIEIENVKFLWLVLALSAAIAPHAQASISRPMATLAPGDASA